jgi:hypothetical protein
MVCPNCYIEYPFYWNYCRQCGVALLANVIQRTQALAATECAESGARSLIARLTTSALTQKLPSQAPVKLHSVENVLRAFPSRATNQLLEMVLDAAPYQQSAHQETRSERPEKGTAQQLKASQEVSMQELQDLERYHQNEFNFSGRYCDTQLDIPRSLVKNSTTAESMGALEKKSGLSKSHR